MPRIFISILLAFLMAVPQQSCAQSKDMQGLYRLTDKFVVSLNSDVESYGILSKCEVFTKDGLYQVKPIGRLINVKIMKHVDESAYEHLLEKLIRHYRDDERVKDIYITKGGTIAIDCRR